MLSQIGMPGLILLIIVCLIAFGSKNLPTIGRSVGESFKEFREAINGNKDDKSSEKKEEKG